MSFYRNSPLLLLSSYVFITLKLSRYKSYNALVGCVNHFNLTSFKVDFLLHSLECVLNCSFIPDTFELYLNIEKRYNFMYNLIEYRL
jgi:hypothetical protein